MSNAALTNVKLKDMAMLGLRDLFYFCQSILKYNLLVESFHSDPLNRHRPRKINAKTHRYFMDLWPRGTYKSTSITIGKATQAICRNPDIKILIVSEPYKNALKYVRTVRNNLMTKKIQALYPHIKPKMTLNKPELWNASEFLVEREKLLGDKTPTCTAGAIGTIKTGMHYDLIIVDDVVNQDNVKSEGLLEKTREFFQMLEPLLEPGGEVCVVGTMYSELDIYNDIIAMNDELPESEKYDIHVISAHNKDGSLAFPELLTEEVLQAREKKMGSYNYHCQYENITLAKKDKKFSREGLRILEERTIPKYIKSNCIMAADIAYTEKKNATSKTDWSSFQILAGDEKRRAFWLDGHIQQSHYTKNLEMCFEVARRWDCHVWTVETFGTQKGVLSLIEDLAKRERFYVEVIPYSDTTKSKWDRIYQVMQPKFDWEEFFISSRVQENEVLWQRFLSEFDFEMQSRHDDVLDTLSLGVMGINTALEPATPAETVQLPGFIQDIIRRRKDGTSSTYTRV